MHWPTNSTLQPTRQGARLSVTLEGIPHGNAQLNPLAAIAFGCLRVAAALYLVSLVYIIIFWGGVLRADLMTSPLFLAGLVLYGLFAFFPRRYYGHRSSLYFLMFLCAVVLVTSVVSATGLVLSEGALPSLAFLPTALNIALVAAVLFEIRLRQRISSNRSMRQIGQERPAAD